MSLASTIPALLLAAAASGPKACSPDAPGTFSQAGAKAYIRRAETDWAASVAKDEAAYLRRVVAGGFVGVLEGKVLDHDGLIAEAESRGQGAASDTLESIRIHLSGPIAVAEGVEVWTDNVRPRRTRIVWSDIWVHCGTWRLTTSTSVGTPAHYAAPASQDADDAR